MALNFVPGLDAITIPISTAAGIAHSALGDKNYERVRSAGTWASGATAGFLPIMPVFWPAQIAMMIIFVLVLIYVFKVGVGRAFLGAYVGQAIVITFAAQWLADKFLRYGVGV